MGINVESPLVHEKNLAKRPSPILSDGTALSELIDLEKREVKMRVLTDPEIYRMELKRIYNRAWMIVGHVTEIPEPGDFVRRYIGSDAVIVTRGRDGEISIFLNACSHRGMELCRVDQGNLPSFKCPYHGWVFNSQGNLLGAPFEKEMYGAWDKSQYGLRKVQVAIRHGVIFGAFSPKESLDDWMGEFSWYFDSMYGGVELEALSVGALRQKVASNWKSAGEQNCGDGYHAVTLHHGIVELGMQPPSNSIRDYSLDCHDISSYEGHGLRCVETAHAVFKAQEPEAFPVGWFVAGAMFPGVNVSGTHSRGNQNGMIGPRGKVDNIARSANIGGMFPQGVGAYNQWSTLLVEKSLSPEVKASMRRQFGTAIIGADDQEAWPSMQRVAEGGVGEEQPIRYNAILGPNKPADWPGPALVHQGVSKDDNQWHFWLRWYDLMTQPQA